MKREKVCIFFELFGGQEQVFSYFYKKIHIRKGCDLNNITNSDMTTNFILILTQLLLFIIVLIVRYLWKSSFSYDVSIKNWLGCFVVSVSCFLSVFILIIYMIQNDRFDASLVRILFIWIGVNFSSFYFYFVSAEKARIEIEMEVRAYQKQIQIYETWYEGIQQTKKEIQSIRHDMKNHFTILRELCKGEIQAYSAEQHLNEIGSYLDHIGINVIDNTYNIDSGNVMLDAIVTVKKNYALSKGIFMDTEIYLPKNMNYNNVDVVVILGNILDNAIEACEKLENTECRIYLKMEYKQSNIIIMEKFC